MPEIASCLPDYLPIPARVARDFHVIGLHLTARDISYAVAVLWLMANTDVRQRNGDANMHRIPDNGLRHAMGLTRRESIDTDDERMKRLQGSTFGHYQCPWSASRHNLDDKRTWVALPGLVDEWRILEGEPVIYLPLLLLQRAKSRISVEAYMHAMALAVGFAPANAAVVRREDDRVTIHVDENGFRRFIGANSQHTTHRVKTELLAEIDRDLPAWADTVIEPVVRMSKSERFPKGRFMYARIHVIHPPVAEIEARAANVATWLAPIRTSVPGWETRPTRPKAGRRKLPPPAPIDQVAYIHEPEIKRPVIPRGQGPKVDSDSDFDF